jgi:hypothetical protein
VVDRTDLRIASNNSACGGDVASYLTGARTRFASHVLDPKLTESEFVVQQVSTGKTVRVRVKPEAYPTEVRVQMRKIESGNFKPEDIDLFQELQWEYAKKIITRPLSETFTLLDSTTYMWLDPPCRDLGTRKDNSYKAAIRETGGNGERSSRTSWYSSTAVNVAKLELQACRLKRTGSG